MQVILIAALTADGFIGQSSTHLSTKWTSKEDFAFFSAKTKECGVCVMGSNTFATVNRPLKDRISYVYTSNPEKVAGFGETVIPTDLPPGKLLAEIAAKGFNTVALLGGARVYTQWMQAGVVTKLLLTVEPVLFGAGVKLFDRPLSVALHLDAKHELSSQTTVFEYSVPGSNLQAANALA